MPVRVWPSNQIKFLVEQFFWPEPFEYQSLQTCQLSTGETAFIFYAPDFGDRIAFVGISPQRIDVAAAFLFGFENTGLEIRLGIAPLETGNFITLAAGPPPFNDFMQYQIFTNDGSLVTPETITDIPKQALFGAGAGSLGRFIIPSFVKPEPLSFEYHDPYWVWTTAIGETRFTSFVCDDLNPTGDQVNFLSGRTSATQLDSLPFGPREESGTGKLAQFGSSHINLVSLYLAMGQDNQFEQSPYRFGVIAIDGAGDAVTNFLLNDIDAGDGAPARYLSNIFTGNVFVVRQFATFPIITIEAVEYTYNGSPNLVETVTTLPMPPDLPPDTYLTIFPDMGYTIVNNDGTVTMLFNMLGPFPVSPAYMSARYSATWELLSWQYPWEGDYNDPVNWAPVRYPLIEVGGFSRMVPAPDPALFSIVGPVIYEAGGFPQGLAQQQWGPDVSRSNLISWPLISVQLKCVPCADVMFYDMPPSR